MSMIGAARVGERRLKALYDLYGADAMTVFIQDLLNYGEFMMKRSRICRTVSITARFSERVGTHCL